MADTVHIVCPSCNATNRVDRARAAEARCGQCKQALFSGHPVALTAESFDRQLAASDVPVIVDFWASWCGPCRMMAPAYEQAAQSLEPRFRLAKLDTEAAPEVAARFAIRGIPTMIAFRGGREVGRRTGAMTDVRALVQWIESQA